MMASITIRNLPDSVHASLKQQAAAQSMSLEALARRLLAATPPTERSTISGFAEAQISFILAPGAPPAQCGELWGALIGTVHIPTNTDLTAPLGAPWDAES